jgi:hypothetical protein
MIYALNVHYGPAGKPLTVKLEPTMPGKRGAASGHAFVFGSESHPSDFRCQACGHFAWGWHEPDDAWRSEGGAIELLAKAALDLVRIGQVKVSPAMAQTLRDWRDSFAGKDVSGTWIDAGKVRGPLS